MKKDGIDANLVGSILHRLVDVGGTIAQDFGFSRIAGQVMTYLFLSEGERSLDTIEESLYLSKAAVSVASRQLEALGLIRRVHVKGDRKRYYRSGDDLATVLHQGLLIRVRTRLSLLANELQQAASKLPPPNGDHDLEFLWSRVTRAESLRQVASSMLDSPLLEFLTALKSIK